MNIFQDYLPRTVNSGPWLTAYTLEALRRRIGEARVVLPICSLGTPYRLLAEMGELLLPPLFHEALDDELKLAIVSQIRRCFPYHGRSRWASSARRPIEVVEVPRAVHTAPASPRVLAFSVDTAVEQHGPHLPLATDTIQSYEVLRRLAGQFDGLFAGPPIEYGHLTWGLPFGMSIDLTPAVLTQYVRNFANAVDQWMRPDAMYVVDVHGSIVHRNAIQEGLKNSRAGRWAFRWLYDPIVEFAGQRGDQHAGGVETAMVELASSDLVDKSWWPARRDELAAAQMSMETAVELTPNLPAFIAYVESHPANGIVGNVGNYDHVDANVMIGRMLDVARGDVEQLLA